MTATTPSTAPERGILRRPYALTTTGSWSLVFLAAFESLAITTIMPIVTADLDGRGLYSLAFSTTLAAGVVGMVVTGSWADSRGPTAPLLTAIGLFGCGLVVAGTAPSMAVFVAGRFLQGLGAGGITVALYVLIAKVYPSRLHVKIFGAYASAWVLPSIVGPFVAGVVADALSWHWVFLGVVVLVAVALAMIVPALRGVRAAERRGRAFDVRRATAAAAVAIAVVALGSTAELDTLVTWVVAPLAVVAIGLAGRALFPAGTYQVRRGLPAAVVLGGAAGAVFFGTEVYLPLLLQERYGLPAWLSGITLTAAAIAWALASAIQGRTDRRLATGTAMRWGGGLLAIGTIAELVTAALTLPAATAAIGWFLAGAGMGTLYPRISALVLAKSEPGQEGFNTSAKSIADSVAGSMSLALTGLIFVALGDAETRAPYVGVLLLTSGISVMLLPLTARTRA
jgi:MFS family permease